MWLVAHEAGRGFVQLKLRVCAAQEVLSDMTRRDITVTSLAAGEHGSPRGARPPVAMEPRAGEGGAGAGIENEQSISS